MRSAADAIACCHVNNKNSEVVTSGSNEAVCSGISAEHMVESLEMRSSGKKRAKRATERVECMMRGYRRAQETRTQATKCPCSSRTTLLN